MINDVKPATTAGNEEQSDITEQVTEQITELSEDMEMVSPGAMLRDARKALSLSQEHISSKLNFKVALVNDLENDIFDPSMPVTFNRGYLVNYAKLVAVDVEDVLASYDALDAASIQRTELLSFSKETTKQAEHSRVMWLSYLIIAILIGLTVLWWQQESDQQATDSASTEFNAEDKSDAQQTELDGELTTLSATQRDASLTANVTTVQPLVASATPAVSKTVNNVTASEVIEEKLPALSTAVFTFNGDCWVNIYDATGERIAWGVKKSGYIMTIEGKAPLLITVGKPELTSIVFNGKAVDMSAFNQGNIAKFTLPLVVN